MNKLICWLERELGGELYTARTTSADKGVADADVARGADHSTLAGSPQFANFPPVYKLEAMDGRI